MISTDGNNFLSAYLEANKRLVQTLVVKSDQAALLINDGLERKHGLGVVDSLDAKTWKYYLNLEGKRHFTNSIITIGSLDTHEQIEFTPENLLLHPTTKEAYKFGSRYYYGLLNRYKDDQALIRGVLTPVPFEISKDAATGSILAYGSDLVESQESTLIYDLQDFIQGYLSRWFISGFQQTDPYYACALYGVLAMHTLGRLLNLRHARCHTEQAHSFFIREYLASFGKLDRFIPYLKHEQVLYLYRNVKYLHRHAGSVEQFQELVEKILVKRKLPLAEYSVNQMNAFADDGYIVTDAKKKSLTKTGAKKDIEFVSMDDLYAKVALAEPSNPEYLERKQQAESHRFRIAASSVTQTKTLESHVVDYSDAMPDPVIDVFFREWGHSSAIGLYTGKVAFTDPATGKSPVMSAADAFMFANYLSLLAEGFTTETMPGFMLQKFRLVDLPARATLLAQLPAYATEAREGLSQLYLKQPLKRVMTAVDTFNYYATRVYNCCLEEWMLTSNSHEIYTNAALKTAISQMYGSMKVQPAIEDMTAWFALNSVSPHLYTPEQAKALAWTIFQTATGYTTSRNKTLRDVQKQLIGLFKELSSYSIQVVATGNASRILLVGSGQSGVAFPKGQLQSYRTVHTTTGITAVGAFVRGSIDDPVVEDVNVRVIADATNSVIKVLLANDTLGINSTLSALTHNNLENSITSANMKHSVISDSSNSVVIGQVLFDSLSESQKSSIKIRT